MNLLLITVGAFWCFALYVHRCQGFLPFYNMLLANVQTNRKYSVLWVFLLWSWCCIVNTTSHWKVLAVFVTTFFSLKCGDWRVLLWCNFYLSRCDLISVLKSFAKTVWHSVKTEISKAEISIGYRRLEDLRSTPLTTGSNVFL